MPRSNRAGARAGSKSRKNKATTYVNGVNAREYAKNQAVRATGKTITYRKARIPDENMLEEMKQYRMVYGDPNGVLFKTLTRLEDGDSTAAKGYEKYYNMLWHFFQRIGRTRSFLILCDYLQKGVPIPPIRPIDIYLFMLNKRGKKGSVVESDGVSFVCDGGWRTIGNEELFRSAISYCHTERGHVTDAWHEICDLCTEGRAGGEPCGYHAGNTLWYEHGNVIYSTLFKDQFKIAKDATAEMGITKANSLTRDEMFKYGTYLCSGDMSQFMLYVIMVVGGSCYCRESGVNSLQVESIMTEVSHNWMGPGTQMEFLALDIRGKSRKQLLMSWRNDTLFLCPINVLFWWMNVTGIRTGFLFPPLKNLKEEDIDSTQAISQDAFAVLYRNNFKYFFPETEYPDKPNIQNTPHGIRRGRFLEACMGGATDFQMQEDSGLRYSLTLAAYLTAVRSFVDRLKVERPDTWNMHVMPYKSQNLRYEDYANRLQTNKSKLSKWLNWFGTLFNCDRRKISDTAARLQMPSITWSLRTVRLHPCVLIYMIENMTYSVTICIDLY